METQGWLSTRETIFGNIEGVVLSRAVLDAELIASVGISDL